MTISSFSLLIELFVNNVKHLNSIPCIFFQKCFQTKRGDPVIEKEYERRGNHIIMRRTLRESDQVRKDPLFRD